MRSVLLKKEISDLQMEDTARDYCFNHCLNRPDTDVKTVLKWLLALELLIFALTFVCGFLLGRFDISFSFYNLYLLISFFVFFICLKKICVLAIECYQHYASEKVRRSCTLMPSCSEYALLALQKYNVFKAIYKTYIRLTQKCKGSYEIDYP